jgi:hypothetical protein
MSASRTRRCQQGGRDARRVFAAGQPAAGPSIGARHRAAYRSSYVRGARTFGRVPAFGCRL